MGAKIHRFFHRIIPLLRVELMAGNAVGTTPKMAVLVDHNTSWCLNCEKEVSNESKG